MRPGKGTTGICERNRKGRWFGEKEPSSDSEPRTVTEITQEDGWEREERITASQTGESAEKGCSKRISQTLEEMFLFQHCVGYLFLGKH